MKKAFLLIFVLLIIFLFWFGKVWSGENQSINITVTDYPERKVTISHEFGVSASVKPNDCNTCIKNNNPSDCLVVCKQVIYYDNEF